MTTTAAMDSVVTALAAVMKAAAWRKSGRTFNRRTSDNVVQVVNLQVMRTIDSAEYAINVGVWCAHAATGPPPRFVKEYEGHLRGRFDLRLPTGQSVISPDDPLTTKALLKHVQSELLPALARFETEADILALLDEMDHDRWSVRIPVSPHLAFRTDATTRLALMLAAGRTIQAQQFLDHTLAGDDNPRHWPFWHDYASTHGLLFPEVLCDRRGCRDHPKTPLPMQFPDFGFDYVAGLIDRMTTDETTPIIDSTTTVSWAAWRESEQLTDPRILTHLRAVLAGISPNEFNSAQQKAQRHAVYGVAGKLYERLRTPECLQLILDWLPRETDGVHVSAVLRDLEMAAVHNRAPTLDGVDLSPILQFVVDRRRDVRVSALELAGQVGFHPAEHSILDALTKFDDRATVRAACSALRTAGTVTAVGTLTIHLESSDQRTRRHAQAALAAIQDSAKE